MKRFTAAPLALILLITVASADDQAAADGNSKPARPAAGMDNLVYPLPDEPKQKKDDPLQRANPYSDVSQQRQNSQISALRYACMMNDLIRRVEVDYYYPHTNVPCEVSYYKDVETPGIKKVLWSSQTFEGYCEEQASNLVTQLEDWGWACQPQ